MCPKMTKLLYCKPVVSASFKGNEYHDFLKFLQYPEFLAYVTMEPSSLHQDAIWVGRVLNRLSVGATLPIF